MLGMQSAGGGNADQFDITGFFDGRKKDGVGEEPAPKNTQFDTRADLKDERGKTTFFLLSSFLRIGKQHTQKFFFFFPVMTS